MGQLGFQELILIFVVALLVFGPRKLPELGKSLGKGLREFRRATNDLKATWEEQVRDAENELSDTRKDLRNLQRDVDKDIRSTPRAAPPEPAASPEAPASPEPAASPKPAASPGAAQPKESAQTNPEAVAGAETSEKQSEQPS